VSAPAAQVRWVGRPSAWWIVLAWPVWLLVAFLMAYAAKKGFESAKMAEAAMWAGRACWIVLGAGLLWRVVEWMSRRYEVTDEMIRVRAGVFVKVGADIPTWNIQHATLHRGLFEQLLGLGSIGIATAGNDGPVAYLVMVPKPSAVLDVVQRAAEEAERPAARATSRAPVVQSRPIVIGLAGGIGAGKSAVAKVFAEGGALVIDSDREARDALDRPEVRGELIRWWGDGVLDATGRIDRKKVGEIVFSDPAQRERLERLVHPLVRATRKEMIARTDPRTTPAVIVDAPLLFEAGLDKECDAVVFVDAPRESRLNRVRETRGWDEGELNRREKVQLPLEEKRRRADVVITNDGTPAVLRSRSLDVYKQLLDRRRTAQR